MCCKLLKLFPLMLFGIMSQVAFGQGHETGLHLLAGPALSQIELEGSRFKEERYLAVGLATTLSYQMQSTMIGVKSTAVYGAHNHDEQIEVSEQEEPVRRYIQHVNFSPYIGFKSQVLWKECYGLQLELGPAQAITSLRHKDDNMDNSGAKRKKSSFTSKGYELGFGLYKLPQANSNELSLMFNLQILRSEKQYLLDVSEFRNALTLSSSKSYGIQDLHNIYFVINYSLF